MRLRLLFGILSIIAIAAVGVVALPGTTRGDTPEYTTYAGQTKYGTNFVLNWSEQSGHVDFYGYQLPLDTTNCPGQFQDFILPDITVANGTFDQFDGVQGVQGTYGQSTMGAPIVEGNIYLGQGTQCAIQIPFFAGTNAVLQGDVDCGWLNPFQIDSVGGAQPQGPAPAPKDPKQAITSDDMIAILKWIADLNKDTPFGCPAIESQGPLLAPMVGVNYTMGDTDCDNDLNGKDALLVLKEVAGVESQGQQNCIKVGKFYILDK